MEKLLISACLLGKNCKYNGKNNYNPLVEELKKKYELIPVCPEVMGGLLTPRVPSEINGDKVISKDGLDVTFNFLSGAYQVLQLKDIYNIKIAVLKDGSPSCGSTYIYDGTFTKTKKEGLGITAKLLKDNNVDIYSENEIEELKKDC